MKLKEYAPIIAQTIIAVVVILTLLIFISSCTAKRVVQKEIRDEKVRVEYREILKTDTVTVQLPGTYRGDPPG